MDSITQVMMLPIGWMLAWDEGANWNMQIMLSLDIEQALNEEAHQRGTTPEQLALASLRKTFVVSAPEHDVVDASGTLLDFLGSYIGTVHSGEYIYGGAQLSVNSGEKFAKILAERREQGRL